MRNLFIVPKQIGAASESVEEIETSLELTGDRAADLEAALRAAAFLLAWTESIGGSSGLLGCASAVRALREGGSR